MDWDPTLWITIHLQAQSVLTNPRASSIYTHKSMYGLKNPRANSIYTHKSVYGLRNPCVGSHIYKNLPILAIMSRYFLFRNYHIFFIADYLTNYLTISLCTWSLWIPVIFFAGLFSPEGGLLARLLIGEPDPALTNDPAYPATLFPELFRLGRAC